jgi:hypothetical protein
MARRRHVEAAGDDPSAIILPLRLLVYDGHSGDEYRAFWQEQREWLKERGIDYGDWPALSRVLNDSKAAHGIAKPHRPLIAAEWKGSMS